MRARVGTHAAEAGHTTTPSGQSVPVRIAAIVNQVPRCKTVCEVGYDHGLILWGLLTQRPETSAIGVEIQPASATSVPIPPELVGRVTLRTGDGLAPIAPGEVDGVILAGLGGKTIARILEESRGIVRFLDFVVTCPSHLEADIRPALVRLGLGLVDERLVFDRGRYYEVLTSRPLHTPDIAAKPDAPDELAATWGPLLMSRPDPLMLAYLDDQRRRFAAAFASDLASYRDGPKAALGRKLALLDAARRRLSARPDIE